MPAAQDLSLCWGGTSEDSQAVREINQKRCPIPAFGGFPDLMGPNEFLQSLATYMILLHVRLSNMHIY